ncbi:MAG TPA: cytochrome P450 [Pirellulaceae bacterium]|nr:cytochrome P450 [Pirellulaceae bacterium]
MTRLPPGPRDSLFGLRLGGRFRRNPLRFLTNLLRDYGDLAMFRLGPFRCCLVNHPDLIREVLITQRPLFPKLERHLRTIRSFSGNNIFVSDGERWPRQRQLLQPAFQPRMFERYAQATVKHAQRLVAEWSDGAELDLVQAMARLAVVSIGEALFQVDLSDRVEVCRRALNIHSETLRDEFRALFVLPDWLPTAAKRRKKWAVRTLCELIRETFRERRAAGGGGDDLLSILLAAVNDPRSESRMTQQQALDEATILFVAGQDDITAALSWCWCLLAQNRECEERFRAELATQLGGRLPGYADVARLPFTEMILKETLRLYPPTWTLVPRCAAREVTLGGFRIPRGTWLFISPYATHRDPRFFPVPERFDPDRFSPERQPAAQFAYIPFGGGPRICIGNHFSFTLLTMALATIAQRFRMTLCDDPAAIVPDPGLALRPRGGLRVRLEAIASQASTAIA